MTMALVGDRVVRVLGGALRVLVIERVPAGNMIGPVPGSQSLRVAEVTPQPERGHRVRGRQVRLLRVASHPAIRTDMHGAPASTGPIIRRDTDLGQGQELVEINSHADYFVSN
jgi:hypothetical protein